jgi:ribonuclease HII
VARDLLRFERQAWKGGASRICGIDEVGRGPLAGPVVAAAVVLPKGFRCPGLNDSKKLTPEKRDEFFKILTDNPCVHWSVAAIDSEEIDRINILKATWKAMVIARSNLHPAPDWTLVDGLKVPPLGELQTHIIEGDALSLSIAAASVIAKVTRDRWMAKLHHFYPEYGFDHHKGYSTEFHLTALRKCGPCPIHRRSFEPVRLAESPTLFKMDAI